MVYSSHQFPSLKSFPNPWDSSSLKQKIKNPSLGKHRFILTQHNKAKAMPIIIINIYINKLKKYKSINTGLNQGACLRNTQKALPSWYTILSDMCIYLIAKELACLFLETLRERSRRLTSVIKPKNGDSLRRTQRKNNKLVIYTKPLTG